MVVPVYESLWYYLSCCYRGHPRNTETRMDNIRFPVHGICAVGEKIPDHRTNTGVSTIANAGYKGRVCHIFVYVGGVRVELCWHIYFIPLRYNHMKLWNHCLHHKT